MKNNIINRINKFFQNIDLRKFFGTIVGGIFFLCCVAYFTYAYYEWKSDETSIALTIHEASVECTLGPDVIVSNIGPVLKISDGVKTSFGIENTFTEDMAVSVTLDITSISEELLDESFKWAIVEDIEGGDNFDYENPIIEGSFKNFRVGNNLITTALPVTTQNTTNYQFIVYIDGNIKNDISMMQNSMEASLSLGNCGADYIYYDELTQFAFYSADDNSLTFTYDYPAVVGDTYQGKTVTNLYTGYDTTKYNSASAVPWYSDGNYDDITSVTFLEKTTPISTAYWFNGFMNVENMNLEKLDTSSVTTMNSMFFNCSSLVILNVDKFNTSNVTDMYAMFGLCSSLIELDLSNFDTRNVSLMNPHSKSINSYGMFGLCSNLKYLDLSNFNISKLDSLAHMFKDCFNLNVIKLDGWDTSNIIHMGGMFTNCKSLQELDLSGFDTSNVEYLSYINRGIFSGCSSLTELDVSNWDVSNVTSLRAVFSGCSGLTELDVSNWDVSNVTSLQAVFSGCSGLTELDVSNWDVSNVTYLQNVFSDCSGLTELDVSNWDVSNVINLQGVFSGCSSLTELDVSNWDVSNATDISRAFYNCSGLTELDVSNWDVGKVTLIQSAFYKCSNLRILDLSEWEVSYVTNMYSLFEGCSSLVSIYLSEWDVSNVTDMHNMFYDCRNLPELDLSKWNTSSVTNMNYMFRDCPKLVTSLVIMNPSVTYVAMFSGINNTSSASITLYYVGDNPETTNINESTEILVNNMKGTNTKVFIGGCYGEYCSSTGDVNEEGTV